MLISNCVNVHFVCVQQHATALSLVLWMRFVMSSLGSADATVCFKDGHVIIAAMELGITHTVNVSKSLVQ